jgi:hypothetical protein
MQRFLMLILLMFFITSPLLVAQQKEEEEILPPKQHAESKIGGAGGFTPAWLFVDVDPLNKFLASADAAQFDGGGTLLLGGQGYGYIMLLPNVRVGGMGASGSRKTTSYDKTSKIRRDVELSVGFGGVTIDYVIPVIPRLDVACGGLLGAGSLDIKMTRDDGSAKLWGDVLGDFGNPATATLNYTRKLSGSFFVYQPSVNVEYAVLRWFGVRVGISYFGMAGGDWKMDDRYDLLGVPDKINGKGWMINTGVFLGTFLF